MNRLLFSYNNVCILIGLVYWAIGIGITVVICLSFILLLTNKNHNY